MVGVHQVEEVLDDRRRGRLLAVVVESDHAEDAPQLVGRVQHPVGRHLVEGLHQSAGAAEEACHVVGRGLRRLAPYFGSRRLILGRSTPSFAPDDPTAPLPIFFFFIPPHPQPRTPAKDLCTTTLVLSVLHCPSRATSSRARAVSLRRLPVEAAPFHDERNIVHRKPTPAIHAIRKWIGTTV